MIEAKGVTKSYGELQVLKGIDLEIRRKEVISIVGASGAGKSTLLHIIGTLDKPDTGTVRINGQDVVGLRGAGLAGFRNQNIGFIFQFHNLLPFLLAWENVALVRTLMGESTARAKARAMDLLGYLQVDNRADSLPSKLSGGEAQRVAIARALANEPRIILADEPTAALESERAAIVIDLMKKVAVEREAAVIVVTHDEKIFSRLDRMIHLRDGRMVSAAHGT